MVFLISMTLCNQKQVTINHVFTLVMQCETKFVKSKILDKGPVLKKAKASTSIAYVPSNLQFL